MKRPNFFIAGAPKCGTTSLREYLMSHPNIFVTKPKEPGFFMPDLNVRANATAADLEVAGGSREYQTFERYYGLFKDATDEHLAVGEASADYIMSEVAPIAIAEHHPDARIIIMVRNPVEMIPSLHHHWVYCAVEDIVEFQDAWRTQEQRLSERELPPHRHNVLYTQYKEWGKLGEQVRKWLAVFPRDQVKVVFFDDVRKHPRKMYLEVLEFLGVPDDGRTEFSQTNPAKRNRSQFFATALRNLSVLGSRYTAPVKSLFGVKSLGVAALFGKLNTVQGYRGEISESLRSELVEEFGEDRALLSDLTGRDLSNWSLQESNR